MSNEEVVPVKDRMFLRTVLKKEVMVRLTNIAKHYSTGRGNWDYGVAIEILLDWFESSQLSSVNEKLDLILSQQIPSENEDPVPEEEQFVEMLGGHKIKK